MTWLQLRTYQHFWGLLEFECSGDRNKRDKWRDLLHSQPCSWLAQLVVVLRAVGGAGPVAAALIHSSY